MVASVIGLVLVFFSLLWAIVQVRYFRAWVIGIPIILFIVSIIGFIGGSKAKNREGYLGSLLGSFFGFLGFLVAGVYASPFYFIIFLRYIYRGTSVLYLIGMIIIALGRRDFHSPASLGSAERWDENQIELTCPTCNSAINSTRGNNGQYYCDVCQQYKNIDFEKCPECGMKDLKIYSDGSGICVNCGYKCKDYFEEMEEIYASSEKTKRAAQNLSEKKEMMDEQGQKETHDDYPQKEEYPDSRGLLKKETFKTEKIGQHTPVPPKKKKEYCKNCNNEMRYIPEYDQWYCDNCQKYQEKRGVKPHQQRGRGHAYTHKRKKIYSCPDCGGKMRYIEEYESWYCDNCQEYKGLESHSQQKRQQDHFGQQKEEWKQQTDRQKQRQVQEEQTKQQRPSNLCPDCSQPIRYVEEYNSWYCDNCQEYK